MNKSRNITTDLVKLWMALEVILLHRCDWEGCEGVFFAFLKASVGYSVPVFIVFAFYYSYRLFINGNNEDLKKRLKRLLTPQIGWAVIYWLVYAVTDMIFEGKLEHGISSLFVQALTGNSKILNPTMWFQFDLILLTVLFFFVFRFFNEKNAVYISAGLALIAILMQWSGLNYSLFSNMTYSLKYTLGRIAEVLPYCVIGILLRYTEIIDTMKKNKTAFIILLGCAFAGGYFISLPVFEGFDYSGTKQLIMSAVLVIFCLINPLENSTNRIASGIAGVSRYSLGIYCAHRLVYALAYRGFQIVLPFGIGSFGLCLIVFVLCIIMSAVMERIKLLKPLVI